METPRQGLEKLGAVRTDPDLIGLLFTLIYRVISGRQERAQNPVCTGANAAGMREGVKSAGGLCLQSGRVSLSESCQLRH